VLDDALASAVEELRARQEEEAAAAGGRNDRPESRLPIGEIQTRLRRGKSLKDVAKEAGVDPEWVERFAAPVFAEQAEIVSRVQNHFYKRQRLGPSGLRVGDAVRRNLAERGVQMAPDEFRSAWKTVQRPDGRWIVTFSFPYRGANRQLKFEVRPNGDIVGADTLTSQIAYVTPPKRPAARPEPAAAAALDDAPKRAIVGSGFRAEPVVKAASRPGKERERAAAAMSKAAAKRAADAERAAARKAREREQMLAKREREERLEAQRRERELAAQRREAAAAARLAAAEKAERERAAAAVAAAKQAERDAARRAARLKVKADSKAVAAKRSAAAKASKASTSKKAAVARERAAAAKPTSRPSPAQRVDAPPPPGRAPAKAATKAAPATKAPSKAASHTPAPRPAPKPATAPAAAAAPAAARRPVPEPARPQFRAGLADQAGDGPAARARPPASTATPPRATTPRPTPNGTAPVRPPGARRTRPLRAT
jgi:hypothetical protein